MSELSSIKVKYNSYQVEEEPPDGDDIILKKDPGLEDEKE